jgi:hypothetical protein
MKLARLLAGCFAVFTLFAAANPAHAWWDVGTLGGAGANTTSKQIIKVHQEYKDGALWFVCYFISNTEAIRLTSLDKPDVAAIKKILDDVYAQNKRLTLVENRTGGDWSGAWYDSNEVNATVHFYDIKPNDQVIVRTK